jgi:hypothetical protein
MKPKTLAFIVPLRSSRVSKSWNQVCDLFERTLHSICNQSSLDFKVIVVCHEMPLIRFTSSHVTYIQVNFPLPYLVGDYMLDCQAKDRDKNKKILTGLIHARESGCSYAMVVDADDCISNKIAEFVSRNKGSNGWFLDSGYEHKEGDSYVIVRKRKFHKMSGTSNILNLDLLKIEMDTPMEKVEHDFLFHNIIVSIMRRRKKPLQPLPFPGALYITDTGENLWSEDSLFWQKKPTFKDLVNRFITRKFYRFFIVREFHRSLRNEFGFYHLNHDYANHTKARELALSR